MNENVPTVILAPRVTDDSVSIWRTCLEKGWPVVRLQGWRVPDSLLSLKGDFVMYGEPLFAEAAADQLGLVLLEPSIDWLTTVPREYLSRDIQMTTLGAAREMSAPAFVKPADGKIFEPKVYASGTHLPTEDHVDASIPVLISGIMDFRLEVRCFVRGRTIVTLSPYWRNDELARDEEENWVFLTGEENSARNFATGVLADSRVALPPACTLDVGLNSDRTWAVIEANPCWGAGLYGCDPAEVLLTLKEAVIRKSNVAKSELHWISKRRAGIHAAI